MKETEISATLMARDYKGFGNQTMTGVIECQQVGELQGGGKGVKILEEPTRLFNIYGENCGTGFAGNVWDKEAVSPALMTMQGGNREPMVVDDNSVEKPQFRIRKLTPKECFRLMDFDDADFEKASKVNSDSQLYKQAGNSIVVNCLYLIFKEMM